MVGRIFQEAATGLWSQVCHTVNSWGCEGKRRLSLYPGISRGSGQRGAGSRIARGSHLEVRVQVPHGREPITYPTHPLPGGQFRSGSALWSGPMKCKGMSGAILLGRWSSHVMDMQESEASSVHPDLTQLGCDARIFSSHFAATRRQEGGQP